MGHELAITMLVINVLFVIIHCVIVNNHMDEDERKIKKINEIIGKLNIKRRVR